MRKCLQTLAAIVAVACSTSDAPPTGPIPAPSGEMPAVETSLAFGDSPVEGQIFLLPKGGSRNWRYAVDLDEDGIADQEGVLGLGIGFGYRFTERGIHQIRVDLQGPEETTTVERAVVVNDPDATHVIAEVQIDENSGAIFEGIVADHSGTYVYAGDFLRGRLFQVDASDMSVTRPSLHLEYGPEGMIASPSDSLLYIIHKYEYLTVVAIPSMEIRRVMEPFYGYFIGLLDEGRALISGQSSQLDLIDLQTGAALQAGPGIWHFAISPAGDRVAVMTNHSPLEISLLRLPDLTVERNFRLEPLISADAVAFHPDSGRIYVLGWNEAGVRFLVVDVTTGDILRNVGIAAGGCSFYCAANPVVVSASGRYVAFEQATGILIIDTELDLPLYRSTAAGSVAASPTGDVFYVLRPDGLLSKIVVEP